MAEPADVAQTATASSSLVSAFANEPARKEHTQSQPGATIAKSNPATYAQAVTNSEPSVSPTVKRSTPYQGRCQRPFCERCRRLSWPRTSKDLQCLATQPCRQSRGRRPTSCRRRRRRRHHRTEDPSCCAAGRRRSRQRLSSVNPTGHCDSTPTRRKAAPDEAHGEPRSLATQNAKAHRHAHRHANSRRH
jgi:hypothetical protein